MAWGFGNLRFVEQDLAILTPEKTIVTYRLAGLGSRMLAHVIDVVLVIALMVALIMGFSFLAAAQLPGELITALAIFASFAVPLAYFVLQEWLWNGQTIGKRSTGCRVRMADGTPITFAAALGRNIMRPADMLPGTYLVGLIAVFTNPLSQRLGDLVANTVVCLERRPVQMYAVAPHKVGIHALESSVGELDQMTMEEYLALRRFADRFPELPVTSQNRLITEVFVPIAERHGIRAIPNVHPIYIVEAMVMKYGRQHGLL